MTPDQARDGILAIIKAYDTATGSIEHLVGAWSDLTYDERRYIGAVAPQLADVLIRIEGARSEVVE